MPDSKPEPPTRRVTTTTTSCSRAPQNCGGCMRGEWGCGFGGAGRFLSNGNGSGVRCARGRYVASEGDGGCVFLLLCCGGGASRLRLAPIWLVVAAAGAAVYWGGLLGLQLPSVRISGLRSALTGAGRRPASSGRRGYGSAQLWPAWPTSRLVRKVFFSLRHFTSGVGPRNEHPPWRSHLGQVAEPRCVASSEQARSRKDRRTPHTHRGGASLKSWRSHGVCSFYFREIPKTKTGEPGTQSGQGTGWEWECFRAGKKNARRFGIRVFGFGVFGFGVFAFRRTENGGWANAKRGRGRRSTNFFIGINITQLSGGAARLWAFASSPIAIWRCRASRRAGS